MQNNLVYEKVTIPAGQIGYVKVGYGRPLVMVTRYAATLYNWDKTLIQQLSKQFTLYLIDPRGIGYSTSNNARTIAGYAQDISQAITALELHQPILLGWSFGGGVVQEIYKHYAHNVSGLILLSSFPNTYSVNAEFARLSMQANSDLTPADRAKLFELMFSAPATEEAQRKLKAASLTIPNYNYRLTPDTKELHNELVISWQGSTATDLANITVPTLILLAKNDRAYPLSGALEFLQHIRHSKLVAYPNGGHLFIHYHAWAIAADIITYFEEKDFIA
jgi:pimeloyl-ACP methyl ester carboxylesterase